MVEHLCCLCHEGIAELSRLQICDAILHAKRHRAVGIGDSSKGKVGKGEIYPTLTDAGSIEVTFLHNASGFGEALANLCQLHAILGSKPVAAVQKVFKRHST